MGFTQDFFLLWASLISCYAVVGAQNQPTQETLRSGRCPSDTRWGARSQRKLDFNHCNIGRLDFFRQFSQPKSLRELYMSYNNIKTLPSRHSQLRFNNLYELTLGHNHIDNIDRGFSFPRLEFLDLRNNYITSISNGTFFRLKRLLWLILKENQISHLESGVFDGNHMLRRLELQNNRLRTLTNAYGRLRGLSELNLSNNNISEFSSQIFPHFSTVSLTLDLSGNRIRFLDPSDLSLRRPASETTICLQSNQLMEIPIDESRPNQRYDIALADNPLTCSCEFEMRKKLIKPLHRCGHIEVYSVTCASQHTHPADISYCTKPSAPSLNISVDNHGILLTCFSQGDPEPLVTVKAPSGDIIIHEVPPFNATTYIDAESFEDGEYSCWGKNSNGISNTTANFNIRNRLQQTTEFDATVDNFNPEPISVTIQVENSTNDTDAGDSYSPSTAATIQLENATNDTMVPEAGDYLAYVTALSTVGACLLVALGLVAILVQKSCTHQRGDAAATAQYEHHIQTISSIRYDYCTISENSETRYVSKHYNPPPIPPRLIPTESLSETFDGVPKEAIYMDIENCTPPQPGLVATMRESDGSNK